MANKRNPSFELLRVIAMFLIVVWHFLMHGIGHRPVGVADDAASLFNLCSMELIGCLSKVSTNCYILISGYFLVTSKTKWEKIPKTWMPIFFYSVGICLVFILCGNWDRVGWAGLGKAFMPLYFSEYWFATRYVALVALAPFLAMVAGGVSKKQYLLLLAILFVVNFEWLLGSQLSGNNSMLWFVFLFYVGGYVRLHGGCGGTVRYGRLYFLLAAVIALGYQMWDFSIYPLFGAPFMIDYHANNGIEFFTALMLFMWAVRLKMRDTRFSRLMVKVAPLTFGVYLIHDNVWVRGELWHRWVHASGLYDSWAFVPVLAAVTLLVFWSCIFIDSLRDRLFRALRVNDRIDRLFARRTAGTRL